MRKQEKLARKFSKLLIDCIGAEYIETVIARNSRRPESDKNVCHSHDFCDANMVMLGAWTELFDTNPLDDIDHHADCWNEAWSLAADNNFFY